MSASDDEPIVWREIDGDAEYEFWSYGYAVSWEPRRWWQFWKPRYTQVWRRIA
jgi:hypothetical protein